MNETERKGREREGENTHGRVPGKERRREREKGEEGGDGEK